MKRNRTFYVKQQSLASIGDKSSGVATTVILSQINKCTIKRMAVVGTVERSAGDETAILEFVTTLELSLPPQCGAADYQQPIRDVNSAFPYVDALKAIECNIDIPAGYVINLGAYSRFKALATEEYICIFCVYIDYEEEQFV